MITSGLLLFFIFFTLSTSIKIVGTKSVFVCEIFGKYSRVLSPGLNFVIPYGIERVAGKVSLQIRELKENVRVKTRDNVFADLPVSLMLQVPEAKATTYHYELAEPDAQVATWVLNVLRSKTSSLDLSDLYSDRDELIKAVQESLGERLTAYGLDLVDLLVDEPTVSQELQVSFNRVVASRREREAAEHEAEATRIRIVGESRAEAESQALRAEGLAKSREILAASLAEAVETTKSSGISEREVLSLLLETSRLDTIRAAAETGKLVIMDLRGEDASRPTFNVSD